MSLQMEKSGMLPRAYKAKEDEGERKSFLANASFPKKLYDLVSTGDSSIIRWEEHGKAFRITDPERFAEEVLPLYFRHSKLTSFQRQLNLYGFRRVTKGEDQGSYYHAKFQKGKVSSVMEIRRLQGKAMPNLTTAVVKNTVVVDNSLPALSLQPAEDPDIIGQLDCSVPQEGESPNVLPLGSPPPQMHIPSGFGVEADDTQAFSRNVSDFGWCNSTVNGFDDFDPLDLSLLDALFDSDSAPPLN